MHALKDNSIIIYRLQGGERAMTTVLIADDEVLELQYLCRLFEKSPNFQLVGQAGNGSQAVELASRYKPDIIIMDINMPMSGLEAAKVIRRKDFLSRPHPKMCFPPWNAACGKKAVVVLLTTSLRSAPS